MFAPPGRTIPEPGTVSRGGRPLRCVSVIALQGLPFSCGPGGTYASAFEVGMAVWVAIGALVKLGITAASSRVSTRTSTPGSALSPALVSAWLETRSLRGLGNEDAISLLSVAVFLGLENYHLVMSSTCKPPS